MLSFLFLFYYCEVEDGQVLRAHACVLSATSPYFATLLSKRFSRGVGGKNDIVMQDVSLSTLGAIFSFLYLESIEEPTDIVALIVKADMWCMQALLQYVTEEAEAFYYHNTTCHPLFHSVSRSCAAFALVHGRRRTDDVFGGLYEALAMVVTRHLKHSQLSDSDMKILKSTGLEGVVVLSKYSRCLLDNSPGLDMLFVVMLEGVQEERPCGTSAEEACLFALGHFQPERILPLLPYRTLDMCTSEGSVLPEVCFEWKEANIDIFVSMGTMLELTSLRGPRRGANGVDQVFLDYGVSESMQGPVSLTREGMCVISSPCPVGAKTVKILWNPLAWLVSKAADSFLTRGCLPFFPAVCCKETTIVIFLLSSCEEEGFLSKRLQELASCECLQYCDVNFVVLKLQHLLRELSAQDLLSAAWKSRSLQTSAEFMSLVRVL